MEAFNWDEISPTFSKLCDSFRNPKGFQSLLPLTGCIGQNAIAALQTINDFSKSQGFKVGCLLLFSTIHSDYYFILY